MKPDSINRAALIVLTILGLVGLETVSVLCYLAVVTHDGKDVKELAVFALGAISGVLAKTGVDVAKSGLTLPGEPQ